MLKKVLLISFIFTIRWQATFPNTIAPGIDYEHMQQKDPNLSIHTLEINPNLAEIKIAKAFENQSFGRKILSKIATENSAVAAVNGGFFDCKINVLEKINRYFGKYLKNFLSFLNMRETDNGNPAGNLKIKNRFISTSNPTRTKRGTICWSQDGKKAEIIRLKIKFELKIGGKEFPVNRINYDRKHFKAVLYTPDFNEKTMTNSDGTEIIIKEGKVEKIIQNQGNSLIPKDGFAYSVSNSLELDLNKIKLYDEVEITYRYLLDTDQEKEDEIKQFANMVEGAPVLILNNQKIDLSKNKENVIESFINNKHPRTAVGIKPNGNWIFVVVDGRQPELSVGMNLHELANFIEKLGCEKALNLDGGGSSHIFVNGKIKNSPSDVKERPISNAFLIFPKKG